MGIPKPLVQTNQMFMVLSVLAGLIIHSAILFLPFLIGVYTLVTKKNPIILFSRRFLKKPANQYIQEDKEQQIFNQWIATICLALSLLSFYAGWTAAGYALGIMVIAAAAVALMGFCIGCFIRYQYMMWRHRRRTRT
ncbi:DUF4395 domain-containing protein [Domibacillus sp. A3M-37]|uniref:DUF4395 domain-containing protein n=1 Tax=Domibacillus sp. A3M-37 TaxID=2962037 RepID=UPI0020B6D112|nr:DUF4395 domain-containing protein [Domibacillus sp. A3M-37]MCP3763043.1 DUF4395 domain-containing protein [Domibacillus sp. A3M-37]